MPRTLAIHSGKPSFPHQIHVGHPSLGDRAALLDRFAQVLDSEWLTNGGPQVQELQRRLADRMEVKHCICMTNCTVALEIAIRAAGLSGEVIVPSFTFIATAHALAWQEIRPVFCDIDPRTHTIDPDRVEALINERTTGIIGVHLWGRPCDVEALRDIAERRNLKLLFDAAHAFGCSYEGRPIGGFGLAEVFSFHATKFFSTAEGGAVTTNDDVLANKIRLMKNFGFTGYDTVDYIGTNGKMSELSAAMGLAGLDSLSQFIDRNRRNYRTYAAELRGIEGVELLAYDDREACNYQYVVVEVDPASAGLHRDELMVVLHAENVLARRYFFPGCHNMAPYRSDNGPDLPVTTRVGQRVLCLPTGNGTGPEEIATICAIIRAAIEQSSEVSRLGLDVGRLRAPSFGYTGARPVDDSRAV